MSIVANTAPRPPAAPSSDAPKLHAARPVSTNAIGAYHPVVSE